MNFGESVRRTEQEIHQAKAEALHLQLIIQREAIGLVRHGSVEEHYPIPAYRRI